MATPFETGLAARQGMQAGISDLLMGIRTGQNERDLSLRERGYEARQKENDMLLPYKMAEIESQNTFRKAQADDMLRKSKIQNSLIEIQSAISPIATEMSFIAKVDSDKLRNYQIPDLTFENQDKQMSDYSKAAARKELEILKQSLLDQDDEYQEVEQIVSTARAYSRDPTEPSPLKAGVREMIPLLRQSGFRGLNEFQKQKLLPLLDQYGLVRSADYQKKVSDREKNLAESKNNKEKQLSESVTRLESVWKAFKTVEGQALAGFDKEYAAKASKEADVAFKAYKNALAVLNAHYAEQMDSNSAANKIGMAVDQGVGYNLKVNDNGVVKLLKVTALQLRQAYNSNIEILDQSPIDP